MKVFKTDLIDLLLVEVSACRDSRGFFMETWRDEWVDALQAPRSFVQDNHASSVEAGVVRGLHFQAPPHAQAKFVWVTKGSVFDVAVDIRRGSPTFGKWYGVVLSSENFLRLYVPRGFAHGYMTLEANTEFQYKVDNYYNGQSEGGLKWNAPELGISWPQTVTPILSEKDVLLPLFSEFISPFEYGKD